MAVRCRPPRGPSRASARAVVVVAVMAAGPSGVVVGVGPAGAATVVMEAESMVLPGSAGQVSVDRSASGGASLLVWSPGTATGTMSVPADTVSFVVRARGEACLGAPSMTVSVDGTTLGTVQVGATGWTDYPFPGRWPAGSHQVRVAYPNDYRDASCDRNLRLDAVTAVPAVVVGPPPVAVDPTDPFVGARPWVDPKSPAAAAATARRVSDPVGAAALDRVAAGGRADWYSEWASVGAVAASVSARVTAQTAAGALPVLVVYALPHRDCGSYSVGGLPTADAYRAWVDQFAAGIGSRKAVVVLEPDALAQMDCLSAGDQAERTGLVAGAVRVLAANPGTSVYVDAGNAGWRLPSVMAGRLAAAGVAQARGFSLNVSNFATVASNEAYGDAVSALVGGKHYLVDTGRAGAGPGTTWCNPDGRALGPVFTAVTGDPLADGFAWVKPPGNSDGTCNGGPVAGTFWPDYAIGLAQRAPLTVPAAPGR